MSLEADLAAASDPSTPDDELRRLRNLKSWAIRKAVAENLAAPKDVLADLFLEFPESVLQNPASSLFDIGEDGPLGWIRQNRRIIVVKRIKAEFMHRFVHDADAGVRAALAASRHAPVDVLVSLASDPDENVRSITAYNERTPTFALSSLVKDPSRRVRNSLANNRSTPPDALHELVLDTDVDVRRTVANNPSTRQGSLQALAQDTDSVVRESARRRIANEP